MQGARITDHRSLSVWPGLFLGPVVVLAEQSIAYALVPWACSSNLHLVVHLVKLFALLLTLAATAYAWHGWRVAGAIVPDDSAAPIVRTRFLMLVGMALSAISSLVIIAQWITLFAIPPCVQ